MGRVVGYRGRIVYNALEFELDGPKGFVHRRAMGMEKKNRAVINVAIEKELLDILHDPDKIGAVNHSGRISDIMNQALATYLITNGYL